MTEFEKMVTEYKANRKAKPMYGGTYEIHYLDGGAKYVCYVEVWSEKKKGIKNLAIKKAVDDCGINASSVTSVINFD